LDHADDGEYGLHLALTEPDDLAVIDLMTDITEAEAGVNGVKATELDLSLARAFSKSMQGKIKVDSTMNMGSIFTVSVAQQS
jgi:signal transduction histidine kinase